jgi:uncharacterized membrane protein YagU involved in acid resistance
MPIDLGDPARWRDSFPARQPASSEVAAGAVAGITAGLVAWGTAILFTPRHLGAVHSLRLVAATFFGTAAVDRDHVGFPSFVGALLAALIAVAFGLIFVSILRPAARVRPALLAGALYGTVLFFPAWYGMVQLFDPLLYQAGEGLQGAILALHVLYGLLLGFLVPLLRKILP